MPNYSLVANSVFQPFTYQELAAPLDRQDAYHENLMQQYEQLSSKADVLEAMGKNDRDKGAYAQYKAYSDALRNEADNLYRNGLNSESRMRLTDLRRRYNTEIVPLQNAWNKREQEAQMQSKAYMDAAARGIDLRFSRDAATTSIQDYVDNPNQTFRVINGQQITAEVANQFKALANQLQDGTIKKEQLSPIEYSIITQKGMDWNQYQDFVNHPDDPRYDNIRGIINGTLAAHGISDFDGKTQKDMFRYGAMGVASGVGTRDMQFHTDEYAKDILNFKQQVALQDMANQQAIELAKLKGEIKAGNGNSGDIDYFNRQPGTLPIAVADGKVDDAVTSNAEVFGWRKNGNSPTGYEFGKMTLGNSGRDGKSIEVDLFKNDGTVKKWEEFKKDVEKEVAANQKAYSPETRTAIYSYAKERFEDAVNVAQQLGLDPWRKRYTRKDVQDALEKQRASGAAGYINGYNWNHKNSDWNPTMQNLAVREIKKVDHTGKFTFDSKAHSFGELLDTSSDAEINKSKQDVHAFITNKKGQEGVIFTVGRRQFFLAKDAMSSANGNAAYAFDLLKKADDCANKAKQYTNTNPQEAYTLQLEASEYTNAALSALEIGLVADNSNPTNNVVVSPTPTQNGLLGK